MSLNKSNMFSDNYLYHLTSKENIPSILKEGLKPSVGKNSKKANDNKPSLYLCEYEDIEYWQIILGYDSLLKVKVDDKDSCNKFEYSTYSEFIYEDTIAPDKIEVIPLNPPSQYKYEKLLLSYLNTISTACIYCADYYSREYTNLKEDIVLNAINTVRIVGDKLDYNKIDTYKIRKELKEIGEEGYYTFLDMYLNTGKKLWEQLIYYPCDNLKEPREWLYNFINKNFKGCLDLCTGGWTD